MYKLKNEYGELFVKNLEIIEVNMDYFVNLWYDKSEREKNKNLIEKNKLLIMLGLEKEQLEELSSKYSEVDKFMEELDKINEDPEFREYMSYEEDQRKIFNSRIKEATEKGLNEGLKQGLKQGLENGFEQRNIEIAKNLLNINLSIEDISKATGLSIEEIKNIKK